MIRAIIPHSPDQLERLRRYFRADAAFAKPEVYEFLEERCVLYALRFPSNEVLGWEIQHLLRRPVRRPPKQPIIWYNDAQCQAGSWDRPGGMTMRHICRGVSGENPGLWASGIHQSNQTMGALR